MENQVGKVYGRLTVLAEAERAGRNRRVLVRCSCEAATEKVVYLSNLQTGGTASCGCVQKALTKVRSTTHSLTKHPMYASWAHMKQRCQNPKDKDYADYGARGIAVCERWQKFENFYADMQSTYSSGLTLDREDNSKGYNPENCRWATAMEQSQNRRSVINVTIGKRTQCLSAWALELGLNYGTVKSRVARGKTPEQALQI